MHRLPFALDFGRVDFSLPWKEGNINRSGEGWTTDEIVLTFVLPEMDHSLFEESCVDLPHCFFLIWQDLGSRG